MSVADIALPPWECSNSTSVCARSRAETAKWKAKAVLEQNSFSPFITCVSRPAAWPCLSQSSPSPQAVPALRPALRRVGSRRACARVWSAVLLFRDFCLKKVGTAVGGNGPKHFFWGGLLRGVVREKRKGEERGMERKQHQAPFLRFDTNKTNTAVSPAVFLISWIKIT